jgi:8-oxo-dGTP diphosphatase
MGMAHVEVAVAVVCNSAGEVLLAERTPRQVAAGFWELPGGKIEPGETSLQAAARELAEETGLHATALRPLMRYDHAFPTKRVRLHLFTVTDWRGTPNGREGQRLAWADPALPSVAPILPSNTRVLTVLGLPKTLDIIDLTEIHAKLAAGARLLSMQATRLAPDQRVAVARRISAIAQGFGAKTLLAGSALEADRAGATGLHSSAASLRTLTTRPQVKLWSVAVENAADLSRASALGADLALLSSPLAAALPAPLDLPLYVADDRGQARQLHTSPT